MPRPASSPSGVPRPSLTRECPHSPIRGSGVALAALLLVAGCSVSLPAQSESESPSGVPSSPASCPDIDLRGPTGDRVNLNGAWETVEGGHRGGIYYVRQVGTCLWFVGGFPRPDDDVVEEVGALGVVTTSFLGQIDTDFRIHGTWIDVPHVNVPPAQGGSLDLRIEFDDSGGPRLVYVDDVGERFLDPTLPADELTWVKLTDRWPYPPP